MAKVVTPQPRFRNVRRRASLCCALGVVREVSRSRSKESFVSAHKESVLLSGGNPQIAKADGDTPVAAYISAMPGWKSDVGRLLDSIIVATVPDVRKAVRWNSPFFGLEGQGWFLSFHCYTKYVKVTFHNGASLKPLPPVDSKHSDVRYLHVSEEEPLNEAQFAEWTTQASALPGEALF